MNDYQSYSNEELTAEMEVYEVPPIYLWAEVTRRFADMVVLSTIKEEGVRR